MEHTLDRGALSRLLVAVSIIIATIVSPLHADAARAEATPSELEAMSVSLDLRHPKPDADGSYTLVPLAKLQFTSDGLEPVPPPDLLLLQEYIDAATDPAREQLELQITLLTEAGEAVWHQWVELYPPGTGLLPVWSIERHVSGGKDSESEGSDELLPLSELDTLIQEATQNLDPLIEGSSSAGGGGCSGTYAGTGWWASSNYVERSTNAVRVYTSARADWHYDWATTAQSRYEIAAKGSNGAYSAGFGKSYDSSIKHYMEFDGNDYDRHILRLVMKFREYAFRCYRYDSSGKKVWTTYLGLYEHRPYWYTYGSNHLASTNVFKCTADNDATTTASKIGVEGGTSVTWTSSFSIYGLSLDNTQGESTTHDFYLTRRSGYDKMTVCTRRNKSGLVMQIREK